MVERDRRLDPLVLERGDEIAVVLDALGVLLARPAGKDSSPRDGESVQGGTTGFYNLKGIFLCANREDYSVLMERKICKFKTGSKKVLPAVQGQTA